jgi:hypothetical protein
LQEKNRRINMGYVKNKGWETRFPHNLIRVRVQANSSYQIKRVIEAVCKEKGLLEMDRSDVMRNTGEGPRLRQFVTFKDMKSEKLMIQKQKKYRSRTEKDI